MVPSKSRPEIVARIRAAGLTNTEIAATAGVSEPTVRRDLSQSPNDDSPSMITNSRGEQRPATYQRTEDGDEVIDAEIVDDLHENNKPRSSATFADTTPTVTDDDVIDAEIVEDDDPAGRIGRGYR